MNEKREENPVRDRQFLHSGRSTAIRNNFNIILSIRRNNWKAFVREITWDNELAEGRLEVGSPVRCFWFSKRWWQNIAVAFVWEVAMKKNRIRQIWNILCKYYKQDLMLGGMWRMREVWNLMSSTCLVLAVG